MFQEVSILPQDSNLLQEDCIKPEFILPKVKSERETWPLLLFIVKNRAGAVGIPIVPKDVMFGIITRFLKYFLHHICYNY